VQLFEPFCRSARETYSTNRHHEINHQGLNGQMIVPPANLNRWETIVCRERLAGLLRLYHRNAA
jgi:hypothetical protein